MSAPTWGQLWRRFWMLVVVWWVHRRPRCTVCLCVLTSQRRPAGFADWENVLSCPECTALQMATNPEAGWPTDAEATRCRRCADGHHRYVRETGLVYHWLATSGAVECDAQPLKTKAQEITVDIMQTAAGRAYAAVANEGPIASPVRKAMAADDAMDMQEAWLKKRIHLTEREKAWADYDDQEAALYGPLVRRPGRERGWLS